MDKAGDLSRTPIEPTLTFEQSRTFCYGHPHPGTPPKHRQWHRAAASSAMTKSFLSDTPHPGLYLAELGPAEVAVAVVRLD